MPAANALAATRPKLDRYELVAVRATARTVWLMILVYARDGRTGLGEASDAFGFAATTKENARRMEQECDSLFAWISSSNTDPLRRLRREGRRRILAMPLGPDRLIAATALSALEQALVDLQPPSSDSASREHLPLYANINRAVTPRTPAAFARAAERAASEGFGFVKLAPFDGLGTNGVTIESGVNAVAAVRAAVGPNVRIMVDAHSLFDMPQSIEVGRRLRELDLYWYEEPIAPERAEDTARIREATSLRMAGGEVLFGREGFANLLRHRAVDVIMPDVKHCGGVAELLSIARAAEARGIQVAPHNPSGPVGTAHSARLCVNMPNFEILELQWGEVSWRAELLSPPENIQQGKLRVPRASSLNTKLAKAHAL